MLLMNENEVCYKKEEVLKQDELRQMSKISCKCKKTEIGCHIYWVCLDDPFIVGKSGHTETTLTTAKDGVKGKEWSVVMWCVLSW